MTYPHTYKRYACPYVKFLHQSKVCKGVLKLSPDSITITAQLITRDQPDTHGRRSDQRSGLHSIGHTYVREEMRQTPMTK
eukprot:7274799-Ditylum_brightwellii.AAC.1